MSTPMLPYEEVNSATANKRTLEQCNEASKQDEHIKKQFSHPLGEVCMDRDYSPLNVYDKSYIPDNHTNQN